VLSFKQYLAAATASLPTTVAVPMEQALAEGTYRIRSGRYALAGAVCPLGAADAFAVSRGIASVDDEAERYGGRLLRFAVAFDFCVEEMGLDVAVAVVRRALARRS
jgi:hypothetical protein